MLRLPFRCIPAASGTLLPNVKPKESLPTMLAHPMLSLIAMHPFIVPRHLAKCFGPLAALYSPS